MEVLEDEFLSLDHADEWIEYETEDGDKYYYNHASGESTWMNPSLNENQERNNTSNYSDIDPQSPHHFDEMMNESQDDYKNEACEKFGSSNLRENDTYDQIYLAPEESILKESSEDSLASLSSSSSEAQMIVVSSNEVPKSMNSTPTKTSMTTTIIDVVTLPSPKNSLSSRAEPSDHSIMSSTPHDPSIPKLDEIRFDSKQNSSSFLQDRTSGWLRSDSESEKAAIQLPTLSSLKANEKSQANSDYDGSASSDAFTDKHLKVWNRFFENALNSSGPMSNIRRPKNVTTHRKRRVGNANRFMVELSSSPSKGTPRSVWPSPMKDNMYDDLVRSIVNGDRTDFDAVMINKALIAASRKGDAVSIVKLLQMGGNPMCCDEFGRSPAHYCAKNDDAKCLAMLLDLGVDLETPDVNGRTPMHISCMFGCLFALQFLLESAADVHAEDYNRNTALHFAARSAYLRCCRLLLEYGADMSLRNDQQMTPRMLAEAVTPRTEVLDELIELLRIPGSPQRSQPIMSPSSSSDDNPSRAFRPASRNHQKPKPPHDYAESVTSEPSVDSRRYRHRNGRLSKEIAASPVAVGSFKSGSLLESPPDRPVGAPLPPPWYDLRVDTGVASTKTTSQIGPPPSNVDSSLDNRMLEEDVDEEEADPGLIDVLSDKIWQFTDTLVVATLSMFDASSSSASSEKPPRPLTKNLLDYRTLEDSKSSVGIFRSFNLWRGRATKAEDEPTSTSSKSSTASDQSPKLFIVHRNLGFFLANERGAAH